MLSLIAILTLVSPCEFRFEIFTDFADLLPQQHFVELHNSIKDSFGGANVLVVGVEFDEGDFTNENLARIDRITQAVDSLRV